MEAISQRITELRKSVGLTQNKVAKLLGLPQGSVNRYEHNQSNPTPETLLWYADYFDVSMDYIYGRTDDPHGASFDNHPKYDPEMVKFVDMCFDPKSNANKRLRKMLLDMLLEGSEQNE